MKKPQRVRLQGYAFLLSGLGGVDVLEVYYEYNFPNALQR